MTWASTCSKRQKDTSGSSITVDEDSDDGKQHETQLKLQTMTKKSNPQYAACAVENKFRNPARPV